MAEAPKQKDVIHVYGPLANQRLTMPAADADRAISEGWAYDPYKPRELSDELLTPEETLKMGELAAKAVAKLRGEEVAEPKAKKSEAKAEPAKAEPAKAEAAAEPRESRASTAEDDSGGGYRTRASVANAPGKK